MSCIRIRLADQIVEINYNFHSTFLLCRDYITDDQDVDIRINVVNDINQITDSWAEEHGYMTKKIAGENVAVSYNIEDLEPILVFEKIAEEMIKKGICLLHGAAIAIHDKGFIFTAPSGVGKTTHIMNWLKSVPGTIVVNGDKPLINMNTCRIYGTPWCGKENMNTNTSVPLSGIIALERGINNSIIKIDFKDIMLTLLQQIYIPRERELTLLAYRLISQLKNVPCYRLICNKEKESAYIASKELLGYKY